MTQNNINDSLVQKITQSLNQQAETINTDTLAHLQQARTHALEQKKRTQNFVQPKMMWAGGFITLATVSTFLILMWHTPQELTPALTHNIADIALLTDQNEIDLYDDLDFYIWLEQKEFNSSDT